MEKKHLEEDFANSPKRFKKETTNTNFSNSFSSSFNDDFNPESFSCGDAIKPCRSVENFKKLNRIDEGTYGVVYKAQDLSTGEVVALKKLKLEKEVNGFPITSIREIRSLLTAKHNHIVNVREIVMGSDHSVFMVMDFIEHDLKSLMENMSSSFSISECKTIIMQVLSAVGYLHNNWIIHRDIKTSNILMNNKGEIKVADFGLSRSYGSPLREMTPLVVTLWYRAPELLLGAEKYSTQIDCWSIGCVFAEIIRKEPLLPGKSELDQLSKIFKLLGTPNTNTWPDFKNLKHANSFQFVKQPYNFLSTTLTELNDSGLDFLAGLLRYDPSKRFTCEEALKHQYFSESPIPKHPDMFPSFPVKENKR